MKSKILNIVKILLLVLTFPLWFVKIFVSVGYLPSQTGEPLKVIAHHNMYENVCDGENPFLVYIAMTITILAIALNIINIKIGNKKLQTLCNVVFGLAIVLFIILFLYASTVARGF